MVLNSPFPCSIKHHPLSPLEPVFHFLTCMHVFDITYFLLEFLSFFLFLLFLSSFSLFFFSYIKTVLINHIRILFRFSIRPRGSIIYLFIYLLGSGKRRKTSCRVSFGCLSLVSSFNVLAWVYFYHL